jgi:hypothetical protein
MASFHDVFGRTLKLFDGYGRNMNAWIDCMRDLHGVNALSSLNRLSNGPSVISREDQRSSPIAM